MIGSYVVTKGSIRALLLSEFEYLCGAMPSSTLYIILFAVCISVDTALARLCSSTRPPCPDGDFCKNITCENIDIGICEDINECESDPCQNGGTCNNLVNNYTCSCTSLWEGYNCQVFAVVGTDCLDLLNAGITSSGIYPIYLWSTQEMVEVYCDMETDGGGWTVFQNRFDGSLDFQRSFSEYENGFGDLSHEFWLGLRFVQEIAAQDQTTLRFHMTEVDDTFYYREYADFSLTTEFYVLNIGADSGSPLISQSQTLDYHNGMAFTTYDSDNDQHPGNCAINSKSAWWFRGCYRVNLNGLYVTPGVFSYSDGWINGIVHSGLTPWIPFKTSQMMIRRNI